MTRSIPYRVRFNFGDSYVLTIRAASPDEALDNALNLGLERNGHPAIGFSIDKAYRTLHLPTNNESQDQ